MQRYSKLTNIGSNLTFNTHSLSTKPCKKTDKFFGLSGMKIHDMKIKT